MSLTRLAGTLLICGALAAAASDATAQALKKINDGQVSRTAPNWPSFIAAEKGFFRREGVELETSYTGNVANTVQSWSVARSTWRPRPSTPRSAPSPTAATPC
jgi:ABC-type nitrate/sulfonate/bicarbonate transport system substrate-binding protein